MVELSTSFTLPPAIRRSLRCGEDDDTVPVPAGQEQKQPSDFSAAVTTTRPPSPHSFLRPPPHQHQHPTVAYQPHPSERVKSFVHGIVSPFTACWQPTLNECGGGGSSSNSISSAWNIPNRSTGQHRSLNSGSGPCAPINCGPLSSSADQLFRKQPAVVISPPHGSVADGDRGRDRSGERRASPTAIPPRPFKLAEESYVSSPQQQLPPPPHHQQHHYTHPYQHLHPYHPHPAPRRHYRDYSHPRNNDEYSKRNSNSDNHTLHHHNRYASPVASPRSSSDRERCDHHQSRSHHHNPQETPVSPVSTECGASSCGVVESRTTNAAVTPHQQASLASDNIEKPGANDILCGRGGSSNRHLGNIHFRDLVAANKKTYNTLTKKQKMMIARKIVDAIHGTSPPGRFLAKDLVTGLFYDIGLPRSLEKTSQALREKNSNGGEKNSESSSEGVETIGESVRSNVGGIENSCEPSQQLSDERASASTPTPTPLSKKSGKKVEAPPLAIPPHLVSVFGVNDLFSPKTEEKSGEGYPSPASDQSVHPTNSSHDRQHYPPNSPGGTNYGHHHHGYHPYYPPHNMESPRSEAPHMSSHAYDSRYSGSSPQHHRHEKRKDGDNDNGPSPPPTVRSSPRASPTHDKLSCAPSYRDQHDRYGPPPGYYHPSYPRYDSSWDRYYYHSPHYHHPHPYYSHHYPPYQQPSPNAPVLYRTPSNGYVRGNSDISPERRRDIKRQRSDSFSNHNTSQSFVSSSDVSLSSAVRVSLTLKDENMKTEGETSGTKGRELKSPAMILQSREGSRHGMRSILDNHGASTTSPSYSSTSSSSESSPNRPISNKHSEEKKEGDLSFSGVSGLAALSAAAFLKLDEVK